MADITRLTATQETVVRTLVEKRQLLLHQAAEVDAALVDCAKTWAGGVEGVLDFQRRPDGTWLITKD